MNIKILATAVAGAIAPMAAQALDVSVAGQVNRALRFADNGNTSDVQHLDGAASGSRFGLYASGEAMPGIVAGAVIEEGFGANGAVDVDAQDSAKPSTVNFRKSYLYFSGDFGKVSMGWTGPAGNGIEWTSYNGAWAGTSYGLDTNTGVNVMTEAGAAVGTTFAFFPSVNITRMNTLRYDTPSIGPVAFAASLQKYDADLGSKALADSLDWSFQGTMSHSVAGNGVKGGIFLMDDKLAIAGGIQFAQGTAVEATWASEDSATRDYESTYVAVSHAWGNTSVAIGYRTVDDDLSGNEGQRIGLGVNQNVGKGVSVYAGFHNYSFEKHEYDLEDINAFHIGSLVTFN
jgi:hypothetical protein